MSSVSSAAGGGCFLEFRPESLQSFPGGRAQAFLPFVDLAQFDETGVHHFLRLEGEPGFPLRAEIKVIVDKMPFLSF